MDTLRERILSKEDLSKEKVQVPEWEVTLYVKTLKGFERDAFEASIQSQKGKVNLRGLKARFVILTTVDESGAQVFEQNDLSALNQKSCRALDRLWQAGAKLNGMRDDDVQEMVGNSESGQSEDSGLLLQAI